MNRRNFHDFAYAMTNSVIDLLGPRALADARHEAHAKIYLRLRAWLEKYESTTERQCLRVNPSKYKE